MAAMLEMWGRKNAYNVLKVAWVLAELGLDYVHHDIGSNPGDLETPDFRALNPHARIPVLRDDAGVVWESNTIVRYLCAKYDPAGLCPEDPFERSRAERWMDWELARLQNDFIELFWGYYRTPESERDAAAIEQARRLCAQDLRQLDAQLARQPYIAADRLTMGDIPCAVFLFRYVNMGLDVELPAHVERWYRRLARRDAYRQTVMQPFDELRGRLQF